MARPSKHRPKIPSPPSALPEDCEHERVSHKLIVIWAWLGVYLAAFYLWPLTSVPTSAKGVLRRGHLWIALVLGDETLARWVEDFSWASLVERAVILTVVGAIFLTAVAAGWICLRLTAIDRHLTKLECFVFSAGVGLNFASLATLALGLGGILRFDVFAGAGIATALFAATLAWRQRIEARASKPSGSASLDVSARQSEDELRLSGRWLWLAAPFVVAILASALLPPVDFDAREYHLQAPKEFFQAGRITFLPHNVYANMPLGTEMLSLAGMIVTGDWWTGAIVGKALIGLFAPLGALVLFAAGRRAVSASAGVLAALVYISLPWMALVSTQGFVEGAFAFYLFAALYAVLLAREQIVAPRGDAKPLALAGFLAGGAVSTKYPAVLYCVLPLAAYFVGRSIWRPSAANARAESVVGAAKSLGVFVLACALGCGLWFAKNAVLTGNPTYPLLSSVFDGETRTPEKQAQWSKAHSPPNYDPSDLARRTVDILVGSDWLGPLVVPLAVLAFVFRRRPLALLVGGYFVYIFAAWWLLTHRIDRFWVPALPLLAFMAGIGGAWSNSRLWRATLALFMATGLLFNFAVITGGTLIDNRYLADLAVLRVDPLRVEPWHRYLNESAAEVRRVLLVGDAQPFDLEVPALYNTVFDDCIFERLARGRSAEEIRAALNERGISHVYVSWSEINRYRSPGNYTITDFLQPEVFAELVKAGVLEEIPPIPEDAGQMFRVQTAEPMAN